MLILILSVSLQANISQMSDILSKSIIVSQTDHSIIVSCPENPDPLLEEAKKLHKDSDPFLRLFHHGATVSYRQNSSPSLHLSRIKPGLWEVDIDKYPPCGPIRCIKHIILEVLPHLIFKLHTSQDKIAKML